MKARPGKGLVHSPSAPSLKTSNVLRSRSDLPSTPNSAISSWVTLPWSSGSHSTKPPRRKWFQTFMGSDPKTQRVPLDPLPRSKHALKGVHTVSEIHEHARPAFSKGNLRTPCLPVTSTGNLFKWADSRAPQRASPSQRATEFESLVESPEESIF